MEQLVDFIKRNIQKTKLNGYGWSYTVDLKNSCISSDQYNLHSAVFSGEGGLQELVKVNVHYYITSAQNLQSRFKIFRGIESAIQHVWNFPLKYKICLDCCSLVKTEKECDQCIFYKTFQIEKGKKETCGICQEETYRTILPCKHYFHRACLLKIDPDNLKCPLCRHPMSEDMVLDLFDSPDSDDDNFNTAFISDDEDCL